MNVTSKRWFLEEEIFLNALMEDGANLCPSVRALCINANLLRDIGNGFYSITIKGKIFVEKRRKALQVTRRTYRESTS